MRHHCLPTKVAEVMYLLQSPPVSIHTGGREWQSAKALSQANKYFNEKYLSLRHIPFQASALECAFVCGH